MIDARNVAVLSAYATNSTEGNTEGSMHKAFVSMELIAAFIGWIVTMCFSTDRKYMKIRVE